MPLGLHFIFLRTVILNNMFSFAVDLLKALSLYFLYLTWFLYNVNFTVSGYSVCYLIK